MDENKITLHLSEYEVNIILNALANRPFREVVDTINDVINQRDAQLTKSK